jgi:hypothetical protein
LVWQEAPLALGWQRWRECEEKFAYGLIEQLLVALMDGGHLERHPLSTMTNTTFWMLGAAGTALSEAPETEKDRIKAEYAAVIGRLMAGLRTEP